MRGYPYDGPSGRARRDPDRIRADPGAPNFLLLLACVLRPGPGNDCLNFIECIPSDLDARGGLAKYEANAGS